VFEAENDSAFSFVLDALATFEVGSDDCHGEVELGESGDSVKRGKKPRSHRLAVARWGGGRELRVLLQI
jgi:hypothetical protein